MDGFLNKLNPFKKNIAQLFALLPILLVLIAIPLTLALLKNKQNIGSFAATGNPAPISLNPTNATSLINVAKYFTGTYEDIDGYKNIDNTYLLIDTDGDGKNAFYAYYNQPSNKLYLRDDNSATWLGGYSPTTGNTISNSYFTLDVTNTNTVNSGGYNLVLNWKIKPLTPTGGKTYKIWLRTQDLAGHDSYWKQMGSWTIASGITPTPTPIPISTPAPTPTLSPITTPTPTTPPLSGSLVGKHLTYASTYRVTTNGVNNDYLTIGHYDFFDGGKGKINYLWYDAGKNRKSWTTTKYHPPMNVFYWNGVCQPGPISIPPYESFKRFDTTWWQEGNLLKVKVGSVTHEWKLVDATNKFYKLNRPYYDSTTGLNVINGQTYSFPAGFSNSGLGYLSDIVITSQTMTQSNLLASYNGELWQNGGGGTNANSAWIYYSSGWGAYAWSVSSDPDVLGSTYDCDSQTPEWCQSTFLLNYSPYTKLFLYHHYGHDFNYDGCFPDGNHTKQLLGVLEGGKITKMVYAEYSYEDDGYPITSIGRYYQ